MKTGVCSVSFRDRTVKEIIRATKEAGLSYIEWGADVHVKPGEIKKAREVRRLTYAGGLKIASYGSYFGVVYHEGEKFPCKFKKVIKTAKALGAQTIRIWGGFPGCGMPNEAEYRRAVAITRQICTEAQKYGLTLSLECHFDTITEEYRKSLDFIKEVGKENLKIYFQQNPDYDFAYNLEACKKLLPYTTNVHVFHWEKREKVPLKTVKDQWEQYKKILNDENRVFYLEFMPDGKIDSLKTEAKTLLEIAKEK